jgi:hypothetical protein
MAGEKACTRQLLRILFAPWAYGGGRQVRAFLSSWDERLYLDD